MRFEQMTLNAHFSTIAPLDTISKLMEIDAWNGELEVATKRNRHYFLGYLKSQERCIVHWQRKT